MNFSISALNLSAFFCISLLEFAEFLLISTLFDVSLIIPEILERIPSIQSNCVAEEVDSSCIIEVILLISSTIVLNISNASTETSLPTTALFIVFSINALLSSAAAVLFNASSLTSFATTANPFPASPALAASTEAFNASIPV